MLYSKYTGNFVFAIAVSFFLALFSPFLSYSQADEGNATFILKGNTKLADGKAVEGVDIEIKKNGQTVNKIVTGKNGRYNINIDIDTENQDDIYMIYISQQGKIPKTLSIKTYISPEEYKMYGFPRFEFELPITLTVTTEKDIVVGKASGQIAWDDSQHGFAFDQTYVQILQKEDPDEIRKKKEEEARKKAEEEARLKAQADSLQKAEEAARLLAEQKLREEADKILQANLEAMKQEMRAKRMQDSLDSLAAVSSQGKTIVEIKKISKPVSPEDVDENAFDGTGAYSINIAKKALKDSQEKMNREKAANMSAKYETNNTLTSLLNMVDEHDKSKKIKSSNQ